MDTNALILIFAALITAFLTLVLYFRVTLPAHVRRQEELVDSLVTAVNLRCPLYKDAVTYCLLVCDLMGQKLNFSSKLKHEIEIAAKLRGIGLTTLPYEILQEDSMRNWTAAEKYIFQRHAFASHSMTQAVPLIEPFAKFLDPHPSGIESLENTLARKVIEVASEYSWNYVWFGSTTAKRILSSQFSDEESSKLVELLLQVLPSDNEVSIAQSA